LDAYALATPPAPWWGWDNPLYLRDEAQAGPPAVSRASGKVGLERNNRREVT